MQTYNAMLRLAGDLNNTVPKFGLTAPEIIVLKAIHGEDAVVDIQKSAMDKRPHEDERARLEITYGHKVVTSLFGPPFAGGKLPVKLEAFKGAIPAPAKSEEVEDTFAAAAA